MLELYEKYHLEKNRTMIELFEEIKNKFHSKKVLYPGCYVHITPSLIFSDVTYVDSFKNTNKFYGNLNVKKFIDNNKRYDCNSKIKFYLQDYSKKLPEKENSFDLVISQFGGFVGQGVKKYLKKGGILVCNDSHGDASLANLDSDYKLIAVYNEENDEKYILSYDNLNEYFVLKKEIINSKKIIEEKMKGLSYTKSPTGYIFKKINT